ncbi:MAG: MMCAP2_0565 family pilin-like conjugal transfer protein [Candidatus Kerfeldbacteria bacterium]
MKHRIETIASTTVVGLFLAMPALAQFSLTNPLGNVTDPNEVIANVIRVFLGIVGIISLIIIVYGGFLLLTSGGSPERVKKGRDTLMWAAIGLVVVFASYGITEAIFRAIAGESIV